LAARRLLIVYLPAEAKCGTSKCMNTEAVASKLVALCREQKWLEPINSLYADDIVSVEAQEIGEIARLSGKSFCLTPKAKPEKFGA
jgi:hypothetical protein